MSSLKDKFIKLGQNEILRDFFLSILIVTVSRITLPVYGASLDYFLNSYLYNLEIESWWVSAVLGVILISINIWLFTKFLDEYRFHRVARVGIFILGSLFVHCSSLFLFKENYSFLVALSAGIMSLSSIVVLKNLLLDIRLIFNLKRFNKRDAKSELNKVSLKGFIPDNPLDFETEEELIEQDILGRQKLAKELSTKIINQEVSNSFSLGVNANWGDGKSSFLKMLEFYLKDEKDLILVKFNPWLSHSSQSMVEDFFDELSNSLSSFDGSIGSKINNYKDALLSVDDRMGVIKVLKGLVSRNNSLKYLHNQINKVLVRLDRKVIFIIDDLDRLDKNEILECFKLIRNSGSFKNCLFLTSYSRKHIESMLYDMPSYNQKIFEYEYDLPMISDVSRKMYWKSLFDRYGLNRLVVFDSIERDLRYIDLSIVCQMPLNIRGMNKIFNTFYKKFQVFSGTINVNLLFHLCVIYVENFDLYTAIREGLYIKAMPIEQVISTKEQDFKVQDIIWDKESLLDGVKDLNNWNRKCFEEIFGNNNAYQSMNNSKFYNMYFSEETDTSFNEEKFIANLELTIEDFIDYIDSENPIEVYDYIFSKKIFENYLHYAYVQTLKLISNDSILWERGLDQLNIDWNFNGLKFEIDQEILSKTIVSGLLKRNEVFASARLTKIVSRENLNLNANIIFDGHLLIFRRMGNFSQKAVYISTDVMKVIGNRNLLERLTNHVNIKEEIRQELTQLIISDIHAFIMTMFTFTLITIREEYEVSISDIGVKFIDNYSMISTANVLNIFSRPERLPIESQLVWLLNDFINNRNQSFRVKKYRIDLILNKINN